MILFDKGGWVGKVCANLISKTPRSVSCRIIVFLSWFSDCFGRRKLGGKRFSQEALYYTVSYRQQLADGRAPSSIA